MSRMTTFDLSDWEWEAIKRFGQGVGLSHWDIDLAESALWIAASEYQQLNISEYLRNLDQMAEGVRTTIGDEHEPRRVLEILGGQLFDASGFRGNRERYDEARNSYLNEVIDRRLGIPITLSVVYLEVGWRLGLPLEGVGFPGHFLVKWEERNDLVVDPFNGGRMLCREDCAAMLNQVSDGKVEFGDHFLKPSNKRQILGRMLGNLRNIYLERNDFHRLLRMSELRQRLNPGTRMETRDRALVLYRMDRLTEAYQGLRAYMNEPESGDDLERLKACLGEIRKQISVRN
ncbi:MAG: transglutaminase family protein [Acidobacteria bacterium]|nr:transglutaminase family protein [Acidobacteriota bacterium]